MEFENIVSEIVSEDEFGQMLENPTDYTAYIGYEPSGVLHIGHMVTANAMIELQQMGFNVKVLIADLHAELNGKGSADEMRETGEVMREQLLSFGLSNDTEFVYGSDFQMNEEYQRMVHRLAQETTSKRAERAMADISDGSKKVSHMMYPVMQATDIWQLEADIGVGGMEQRKVHMLARDVFPKAGLEKPTVIHTPLIADLDSGSGKMSNSSGVSISSADSEAEVEEKIDSAYCPTDEDEGDNPILQMYKYHVFPRNEEVVVERDEQYGGDIIYDEYNEIENDLYSGTLHPQDAKEALATEINDLLDSVRSVHK